MACITDTPPPIKSFRVSLKALTGIDCEEADEAAEAMLANLMAPQEILAVMFLKSMRVMLRGLHKTLNQAKADNVYSVWTEASDLRGHTKEQLRRELINLRNNYRKQKLPTLVTFNSERVPLTPSIAYRITADVSNSCDVQVGEVSLAPGESTEIKGLSCVDVSSPDHAVIAWARVGGAYRTGNLQAVLPMMCLIEPIRTKPRRRFWFW